MNLLALEKAKRRYRVAKSSSEALESTTTYENFADHWYIFLHAAKGIYTTLEQVSKSSAQAKQWFGNKNKNRKHDPLLRYVTEARNDDEHGIEESTEVTPSYLYLGVAEPEASSIMRDQFGNTFVNNVGAAYYFEGGHPGIANLPQLTSMDGKTVLNVFTPSKIVLKTVHDRSGQAFHPPKVHLGKYLKDGGPVEVATLLIRYLDRLISEAADFCRQ
ncbi:hypothetical protein [Sphingomonas sp. TREG-RG-20F-R18-01]|uniref:hypothetical protein n=1 Tax=Sphingomonas sp. TREG-RG-20F-R18-01 TaxID=2914982 RepID=UPI001F57C85C|nr:hypothetical protein [Sphingomonas sp. TREG-RG-20F-R18-01]